MADTEHSVPGHGHLWHPYTKLSAVEAGDLPTIVRGEGVYLYDDQGNRYLDAIASWWACALGHSHPRVVAAIKQQADELQHSILGNMSHPRAVELAARLARLMPDDQRHIHFASDGASAVEAALKIAIQYWYNIGKSTRTKFVSLQQAYHGDTLATVSLGYLEAFHEPFKEVQIPALQLPVPPYDASVEDAYRAAEDLFAGHGHELAAIIVEPLCQGAGGMRIYSPEYLQLLYDLAKAHQVLFIVDEIATGMGRTGKMFSFEHVGIDPDIVCVGKALAAGYLPISAAVVRDELYETFGDHPEDHTFYHGHTFAGNPLAAAAAVEVQRIYEDEQVVQRAAELGNALETAMQGLRDLPGVADVRCLGLVGAVELRADDEDAPKPRTPQRVQRALRDQGILVRPLGNVLYLMPPLVIPEDLLCETVTKLGEAIRQNG